MKYNWLEIITAGTAIFSIIIAILTLRSNEKMIEASTRPYVVVYSSITNYSFPHYRIVIKNFGSSAALINNFYYENVTGFIYDSENRNPFEKLNGLTLAPNQSLIVNLDPNKIKLIPEYVNVEFKFKINYESPTGKKYFETYNDRIFNKKDILSHRPEMKKEHKPLEVIAHALIEISDKKL